MDKKYTSYNPEELAGDESFIRWIKHQDNDLRWSKWLEENPGCHENVRKARLLIEAIQFAPIKPSSELKNKMWQHIDAHITKRKTVNIRRLTAWVSSAAAILIIAWMIFRPGGLEEIYVEPGDSMVMALPDESSIRINADSEISFNKETYKEDRVVNLKGEAFFEVQKGQKFIVDLGGSSVEVLGTSFNIFNREDSVSVHCYTGRVKVSQDENSVILTPGSMVAFAKGSTLIRDNQFELSSERPEWINGVYTYSDQSLIPIIREIERQYAVGIEFDQKQIKGIRFSGTFENRMSLETVLETICWPFNLKFTITGDQVRIQ